MSTNLDRRLDRDGRSIAAVAGWVAQELASTWEASWQRHLPMVSEAYQRMGEPAYGLYNRELFAPLQARLTAAGLIGKSKGEWAGLIGAGDVVVSVNVVGGCGS